jgi:hypothetical protein
MDLPLILKTALVDPWMLNAIVGDVADEFALTASVQVDLSRCRRLRARECRPHPAGLISEGSLLNSAALR